MEKPHQTAGVLNFAKFFGTFDLHDKKLVRKKSSTISTWPTTTMSRHRGNYIPYADGKHVERLLHPIASN